VWNAIAQDNLPANVKHCLALQGRPGGVPRAPMPPTSSSQAAPIRHALSHAGVL
jgi:4-hydroxy-tetrahydrodipicolinate synthase